MKKIIYSIASLLIFIIACEDSHEDNIAPTYEAYPIATLLERESDLFSQWTALLKQAGMFSTLNLSANYTCFVPTDNAMEKYLKNNGYGSVTNIPDEDAKLLIRYHTIQGKQYKQSLFTNGVIPDTTATGDFLSIEFQSGGIQSIYVNGVSRISTLDIEATNGIVHAIDDVLIPITETVWDKINTSPYSILAEAIEKTGYKDRINTISESIENESGVTQVIKRYYTLFAVTNQVFQGKGITSFSDLAHAVGASGTDYTDSENALNQYVAYHLMELQVDYASLASFEDNVTTKNLSTLAANTLISVSQIDNTEAGNTLFINYNPNDNSGVSIQTENIKAKNGIIHEVDQAMFVETPHQQIKVTWDLTDYSDLAGLFPSVFQKSNLTTISTTRIEPGSVSCYNWESLYSSSATLSYKAYASGYVGYSMKNYDGMYINLGMYGWVEMQSPTIVAGKYKLRTQCYSTMGTKEGKFKLSIDGASLGSEVTTHGTSTTKDQLATKDIGTITFSSTRSHTIKILQTDESYLLLDYIEFVPQ